MGPRGYLVETYFPRAGRDRLADVVARARVAARAMRVDGINVHYVRPIFVPEDEICFHLFTGPSAHAVGEASRRAALIYDRIVETASEA